MNALLALVRLFVVSVLLGQLFMPLAFASDEKITLQLKWTHDFQFAGFYMALEKGYYRDMGLDVRLLEGGPEKSSINAVADHANVYGVTSTGALLERSYGKPIKVIGAIFQHSPLMLMSRVDTGIQQLEDLRGKRVMLQKDSQNVGIIAALQQAGIQLSDIVRQDISYNIEDLIENRTDAYAVYATNQPYALDARNIAYHIFNPVDYGIDFYGDIIIASDREISSHPGRVQGFMQATSKGWMDALEHPDEAIDLILLKYNSQKLSRAHLQFEANETVKYVMPNVVKPGYMNIFRWQRIAQVYKEQGFLSATYPVEDFVYRPEPGWLDFMNEHLWQSLLALLMLITLFFAGSAFTLRQLVRRKTEALQESEKNYRTLLELADIGIIVHRDGRVLFANSYALQCFQIDARAEVSGINLMDYVHQDDREAVAERIRNVMMHGAGYKQVPVRCVGEQGRSIDAEVGSMLIQYHGEPTALTVLVDVTERKRNAEDSARIQKQMEHAQRLESLGVLAGGIAHDFNNLLAVIIGHADMASLQVAINPPEVRKHLEHVVHASESAASLCSQMLAYSGRGQFIVELVHLGDAVKGMLDLIKVATDENVSINYRTADELALIEADPSQLQQVIMNLVTNASEAMALSGGVVDVKVGQMLVDAHYLDACQHVHEVRPGQFVYIEVGDTGCGMDEQVIGKLFEPFFTTKFTGRGLGMSAMLGIVRSHQGAIRIQSEVNVGTHIRVLFPSSGERSDGRTDGRIDGRMDEQTDGRADGRSDERSDGQGADVLLLNQDVYQGIVLVVDDEESVVDMAVAMLNSIGVETLTASNGQEAVDLYRDRMEDISLVLLDLTMPVMNGEDAAVALHDLNAAVRLVVCSGYAEDEVRGHFKALDGVAFLNKPYKISDMKKAVECLIHASD